MSNHYEDNATGEIVFWILMLIVILASTASAVSVRTYTIKASGGDYTTVQAAETAHNQALTTNDSALTFEISGAWTGNDYEGAITIAGWTMDTTRNLIVIAIGDSKATHIWDVDRWACSTGAVTSITVSEDFVIIDGIQVWQNHSGASYIYGINGDGGKRMTVQNSYFRSDQRAVNSCAIRQYNTGSGWTRVLNCIITEWPNAVIAYANAVIPGIHVYNCTVYDCAQTAFWSNSGRMTVKNTIAMSVGNFLGATPQNFWDTSDFNYTSDASITYTSCTPCGANDLYSQADPHTDTVNGDFSLKTGSDAAEVGVDLTGRYSMLTVDINGTDRDANWDIGAHELAAAGGDPDPVPNRRRQQLRILGYIFDSDKYVAVQSAKRTLWLTS